MTDDRPAPFQTVLEAEAHRQAYVECCVCLKRHPVNVTLEGGRLILKTDRVRFDPVEGFLCRDCTLEQLTERESRGIKFDRMVSILDLLYAYRDGLTVQAIADELYLTRQAVDAYLQDMVGAGTITRARQGRDAAIYKAIRQ
ncbi:MAG: MarR family transcriptional regulator [Spirochaetes bacterium]|nr:MarR family transcriptional regulator [Spirochaetota bacterium]